MTSSLVGSEMCIRDREKDAFYEQILTLTHNFAPKAPIYIQGDWGGRLPVSYTHLTLPTICSV
eukprot:3592365-Prorocentrum_lima.AAC.1